MPQNEIGGGRTMHEHRNDSHIELSFFSTQCWLREFHSLNVLMLELSFEIIFDLQLAFYVQF